jgi:long-chain acyl-CoA synthetase
MDRFWLRNYPQGVPADIDPSAYASIVFLFEESFTKHRDRKAYVCMDKALTFGEIDFREQLPKTNVGKILRRALRDDAMGKAA